jgi:hypothetical protein
MSTSDRKTCRRRSRNSLMAAISRMPLKITLAARTDALGGLTEALELWLLRHYSAELTTVAREGLLIEWNSGAFETTDARRLVVTDEHDGVRITVLLLNDPSGSVVFIEDAPLAALDSPRGSVDLPKVTADLIRSMATAGAPTAEEFEPLGDQEPPVVATPDQVIASVQEDLAPGLLILVTGVSGEPSTRQTEMADRLSGIAVSMAACPARAAAIAGLAGFTGDLQAGSVVSIARTTAGSRLDFEAVGAFSLRSQPAAAQRLVLRHQLAAPVPFSVEQRRMSANRALRSGGGSLDLEAAMELLDEESAKTTALNARLSNAELEVEREWEEQDSLLAEVDSLHSQLRFLARTLRERGELPVGEPEPDDDFMPDTCVEAIIAAKETLPYLVVTALEDDAKELDRHPKKNIWAKKIWSTLRALNDYVRSKAEDRFTGDLAKYREDPPSEAIPLSCDYAPKESESTSNNPATKKARIFRVIKDVDPSGKVYMESHIKIDRGGPNAPRVHFFDDSSGSTQRLHVGYVGPHLPTSSGF